MTRELPYADLLATLAEVREDLPRTRWYGFGSFFSGEDAFSDIDVLAVCSDVGEAGQVRSVLARLASTWPIHLIVMTEAEAVETDFVHRQACRLLVGEEEKDDRR